MTALEKALALALKAHAGQKDKADQPYILHPLRVMVQMEDSRAKIVALLHDVLEDSEITLNELSQAGFEDEILQAVDCLTKRDG
ncbi:MAG TPA: HD domain-containing protein, partial [Caldithrix abyssi]|nr:HD domain-containing protein [Caldithrix abyssi]